MQRKRNKILSVNKYVQAELFEAFINSSDDFRILRSNKRKTYFTIKTVGKPNKEKLWSYIVNFDYGTIRRVVAYMYGKRNKTYINKFAYYCNKKNKVLPSSASRYHSYPKYYDCYIKIHNHLEMYKKLIDIEKSYKPKSPNYMVDAESYQYGITDYHKLHGDVLI